MRKDSFEKFYMEKVALGEGCGCAEMAINMRDVDADMRRRADAARRGSVIGRSFRGLTAWVRTLRRT